MEAVAVAMEALLQSWSNQCVQLYPETIMNFNFLHRFNAAGTTIKDVWGGNEHLP